MTQQTNGMPELKYSEEVFREMYEALKELSNFDEQGGVEGKDHAVLIIRAKRALAKAKSQENRKGEYDGS